MFDHSVTVPRNYKIAANIVQKVSEEGGSVKTLLYDNKLKHFRIDVLYALVSKTIKHAVDIEKIFKSTDILVKEPRLNPWLARVLTAELLYGKKSLPGNSKPVQTILSYKEQLMKLTPEVQDDQESKVVRRPRYVRINTNLLTTSDAIRAFQDDGYKFVRCTSASYDEYLQQVQNLTEYDFTQDYHVKTIFVFSPRMKLHNHDLYMENKIILQDKATALPVHLLAPPPGSVVLDMCAAPGMKTTQLAAYMRNEGKVYAVERDDKRYVTLCNFVESTGSKCVETLHKDSLEIKRGDLDDVEYILLDPSCSGSGMELSVHSYVDENRMAKLTSIQEKFLKHAMNSFPNAKRIVYSTCSIFPEENERVVTNVVKASRAKWRVRNVKKLLKDQWNNFGSGMYGSMGTRCLYAKPDNDLTIGFFLAVLDRDLRDSEKQQEGNKVAGDDKMDKLLEYKTKKHEDENDANIEKYDTKGTTDQDEEKQQTEKKHRESNNIEIVPEVFSKGMNDENNTLKRKKKKRNKVSEISIENEDLHNENTNNNDDMTKIPEKNAISKKKIRKPKVKDEADETNIDMNISIDVNAEDAERNSKEKQGNNGNAFYEQEVLDDSKTDTKHDKKKKKRKYFEELSETKIFENNEEIELLKKKKKKHNHCETESQKDLTKPVKNILTDVEFENTSEEKSELLEDNDKIEMPRKRKKKRKDRENEPNEAVSEIVIDTSMKIENNNTSRNITKSLIENIDGIEKPKKVKKKHKERENEPSEAVIDVASESENGKAFKKDKKKKNAAH